MEKAPDFLYYSRQDPCCSSNMLHIGVLDSFDYVGSLLRMFFFLREKRLIFFLAVPILGVGDNITGGDLYAVSSFNCFLHHKF
jgi:hypothetical protein